MMDLRRYPLDEQNCTLEIESCKSKLHILCLVIKKKKKKWTAALFPPLKYMNNTVILIKNISCSPQLV